MGAARLSVVAIALATAGAACASGASAPSSAARTTPGTGVAVASSPTSVSTTTGEPRVVAPRAQWVRVARSDGVDQRAMVFRPPGAGRHPVVVVLHGSSGLAMVQLAWARRLADAGFVVLAGCYLDVALSARVSSPDGWVRCAGLPDAAHSSAAGITRAYDALLDTATSLPGVEPGVLGVIGVSYGGIVALSTREPRVRAIVADSGYGKAGPSIVTAPVLLLGMTDDPNVSHADVVGFERALRAAGKGVEAHYYSGTGHVATLDPAVAADATNRAIAFFTRNLR